MILGVLGDKRRSRDEVEEVKSRLSTGPRAWTPRAQPLSARAKSSCVLERQDPDV